MIQTFFPCPKHQDSQLCFICCDVNCGLPQIRFCQRCREQEIHKHDGKEDFLDYELFCLHLKVKEKILSEEIYQARQFKSIIKDKHQGLQEYQLYINQLASQREAILAQFEGISNKLEYEKNLNIPEVQQKKTMFEGDFDGLYNEITNILSNFHSTLIIKQGNRIRERVFGNHSSSISLIKLRKYQIPEMIELSLNQQFLLMRSGSDNTIYFYNIALNKVVVILKLDYQCGICYFDELYNSYHGLLIIGSSNGELNVYYLVENALIQRMFINKCKFNPIYLFKPSVDSKNIKVFRMNGIFEINPSESTQTKIIDIPKYDGFLVHYSIDHLIKQSILGLVFDDQCFIYNYLTF